VFGNGGADTVATFTGSATEIGGFGNESFFVFAASQALFFGNEGNDSVNFGGNATGAATVFGGQGNDSHWTNNVRHSLQGNEGNDTLRGDDQIDTIAGGSGNDVFQYADANDDGNNAAGGGPVEFLTDVNWAEDRIGTFAATAVTFAANTGAETGVDLNASANNAIAAAFALNGGVATNVAAQFTFGGRTYVAINQDAMQNAFADAGDLLLDITGVTGSISAGNFVLTP
jgi:hypothetical protein